MIIDCLPKVRIKKLFKISHVRIATDDTKFWREKFFGEIAHSKDWRIIFWRMPKIEMMLQSIPLLLMKQFVVAISRVMYHGAQCRARV